MDFLEAEGGWSLSFAGAGFLGLYHVGATQCLRQRAPCILQGARRFYGSSAGALNALSIVCGKSAGAWGGPGTLQVAEPGKVPPLFLLRSLHSASKSEDCGHFISKDEYCLQIWDTTPKVTGTQDRDTCTDSQASPRKVGCWWVRVAFGGPK